MILLHNNIFKLCKMPSDKHKDSVEDMIKKNLNETGFFLEDIIYTELIKSKVASRVIRELNYSLPQYQKAGSIDLLYVQIANSGGSRLICPIECKKSPDNQSKWVFMSDEVERIPIIEVIDHSYDVIHTYKALYLAGSRTHTCHINSFKFNPLSGNQNRESSNRPYDAMRTANEYITSLQAKKAPKSVEDLLSKDRANVIIPVVCTNAELYSTSYDRSKIDLASGNLDASEISLKEENWVFYNFPMGYGVTHFLDEDYGGDRFTVVVNSKHISSLINYLISSVVPYVPANI